MFGGSRPSVVELADAMAAELRGRPAGSVLIVSHSVGAFVALAMASALGPIVRAVVIVNGGLTTVARFIDAPLTELQSHPRECLGFLRLFALVSAPVPRRIKRAIAERRWASRLVVGKLVSPAALATSDTRHALIAEAGGLETLSALRDNRHHWRVFLHQAPETRVRVVFLVGDRDPMTTVADTRTMAGYLPDAEVIVLEGIGHAAPLEATSFVLAAIQSELERGRVSPT
jgi:pimeloyl-ACP methyl ester carboxylesterase